MITSLRVNNDVTVSSYLEIVEAAEALDFDQIWVSDDLFLRSAPVLVAAAATRTDRIKLGIGIMNPYTVHPSELAMLAATMQELSGGRFLLGLGAGANDFLDWAGVSRRLPLMRTREAARAIGVLQAGGQPAAVSGTGNGWTEDAYLRFAVDSPAPVYVGAMSPRMLGMAGEVADGVLPLLYPPEHFVEARRQVHSGLAASGRPESDVDIAAAFWVSVDEDPARATRAMAEKIAYYGPSFAPYLLERAGIAPAEFGPVQAAMSSGNLDAAIALITPAMLRLGITGGGDEVIARCRSLVAQGAQHLSFGPPLGPDPLQAVEVLGRTIIPALR